MSIDTVSRSLSPTVPGQPTLADVLAIISAGKVCPKHRRQDLCSAIRSLGKVIGRRLAEIPANPGLLRHRIKHLEPLPGG